MGTCCTTRDLKHDSKTNVDILKLEDVIKPEPETAVVEQTAKPDLESRETEETHRDREAAFRMRAGQLLSTKDLINVLCMPHPR